jgi:acyl-CoA synthetase (AMP-forming)/AMP-acid ligase II
MGSRGAQTRVVHIASASTVTDLVRHRADTDPDRVVLRFVEDGSPDRTLTRRELDHAAAGTGSWLRERFAVGDRVLLTYPMGLDFVVGLVGCLYAGMIAVPAPLPGRSHERRRLLGIARDSGAVAALTGTANLDGLSGWIAEHRLGIPALATDVPPARTAGFSLPELGRDSVAILQYTSGSTGDPKGVRVSHGNLLHNIDSMRRAFGMNETTRLGGWIPLYHDMGLMGQLLPALLVGEACVLMTPTSFLRRPHHWLRLIERHGIEVSAAPNFAYVLCCRRVTPEQVTELDLSRWRHAINGSEPIRPATLTGFASHFAPAGFRREALTPCYGLADATLFVSTTGARGPRVLQVDPERLERDELRPARGTGPRRGLVSCGTPADLDVRIVDPATGQPLPAGQVGEIQVRGESVPVGDVRTGDLGAFHDGELYVTGRRAETVVHCGRTLYPHDIEHHLRAAHRELAGLAGAAFTVDEDTVVVVHEVKGGPAEPELRRLASGMTQTAARELGLPLAGVVLVRPGAVRRTTSGKIQRSVMRELFRTDALAPLHVHGDPRPNTGAAA